MFYQLHLLRGFAVLLVVMDHSCLVVSEHLVVSRIWVELAWLAGFLGVTIFFVISGFIMVQTTHAAAGSAQDAYAFLSRRITRIVPMYYLATAVAVITTKVAGPSSLGLSRLASLICSLLFIPLLNARNLMEPILVQGWTLNYEMYFYLLFAGSLVLPQRGRSLALVATLAGTVVFGAMLDDDVHGVARALKYLSAPIVLNFAFGMILGKFGPRSIAVPRPWLPVVISVALGCGMMAAVCLFSFAQDHDHTPFGWQIAAVVYAVSAGSCWLCVRQNQPLPTQGAPGILARLAILLGDASYTIYLFHLFIIAATSRVLILAGVTAVPMFIGCVAVSIIGTVLLHLRVERPLNSWLARRRRLPHRGRDAAGIADDVVQAGELGGKTTKLVQETSYSRPAVETGVHE